MKFYVTTERRELLMPSMTWINLKITMTIEKVKKKKKKSSYSMIPFVD
jgi:hypothetical protein